MSLAIGSGLTNPTKTQRQTDKKQECHPAIHQTRILSYPQSGRGSRQKCNCQRQENGKMARTCHCRNNKHCSTADYCPEHRRILYEVTANFSNRAVKPRTLPKQHEPCGFRKSQAHCSAWMPVLMSSTMATRVSDEAARRSPTVWRKQ